MTIAFEKWQALGNDYLILERDQIPFELTPARIRRICEGHFGLFADGILLLSRPGDPADVADLRIFNPDGSEAELSGNGAREAILYLRRRGWTDQDSFSIHTAAGKIRPQITGPDTCRVDMGRASLDLGRLPRRGRGRPRDGRLGRARTTLSARLDRKPAMCHPRLRPASSWPRSTCRRSARRSKRDIRFPNRTNVSWYTELEPGRARQDPRADLRARGGGDALLGHRRDRGGGRPRR